MPCFVPPRRTSLQATGGHIGSSPEDFRVDEAPLYAACGEGDHYYVRIRKRLRTTADVARILADVSGARERDVGHAGMKDKYAVTTQWFSVPVPGTRAPEQWELPEGVELVESSRHTNKLRTGHLAGNGFRVRVVDATNAAGAEPIAAQLREHGVVNYFGAQRFGRGLSNYERAVEWLEQGAPARGKKSRFYRKLYPSVIQSEIFNRYAARRVALGLDRVLRGEVMRLVGRSSVFVAEDAVRESERLARGEIAHTGPMPGGKTLTATGEAAELEASVLQELELTEERLALLERLAPGTRRDLITRVDDLHVDDVADSAFTLSFRLPPGGYATLLVRELTDMPFDDDGRGPTSDT